MAKPRKRTPQPSPSLPGHGDHSRHAARRLTLAGVGIAVVFAGGWLLRRGPEKTSRLASDTPARTPLPEDERTVFAQYGGSASCRECHQEAFDLWEKSNHALAERPVDSERDRPAFDPPRSFRHGTQISQVRWADGAAEVTSVGLSGQPETHPVARVIGHDPL